LVDELQRRHAVLDEHEFVRVMWRRMYLPHMLFAAKLAAGASGRGDDNGGDADLSSAVNVPFTHVLVSLKRRAQMQQFANYYMSRGISGADHLTSSTSATVRDATSRSPTERRAKRASQRLASIDTTANSVPPVTMQQLRQRRSTSYDVIACVFDGSDRSLKTHVLRGRCAMNGSLDTNSVRLLTTPQVCASFMCARALLSIACSFATRTASLRWAARVSPSRHRASSTTRWTATTPPSPVPGIQHALSKSRYRCTRTCRRLC